MSKLLEKIQLARIESKEMRFFDKMMDIDLLIIEDFGMKVFEKQQLLDFYELIEDRHGRKSLIVPASCLSATGMMFLRKTRPLRTQSLTKP